MSIIVDQHNFLQKKRELGRIPYKQKTSQKVEFTCSVCGRVTQMSILYFLKKTSLTCGRCSQKEKITEIVQNNKEEWVSRWQKSVKDKYGVDNIAHDPLISEKKKKTCKDRYGCEYAIGSKTVRDSIKNTLMTKYGVDSPTKCPEISSKIKNTNLQKYGVEYPLQNPDIHKKISENNIEKYGRKSTAGLEETLAKKRLTNLKKYGVEENFTADSCREKSKKTMVEKYGCEHPAQNEELKRKMRISGAFESQKRFKAYRYKDINFDSSYELAFYIYLEDHHKDFLYQPDLPLKYIGNDSKEHNYFPDFLVNGNFYEIKGGQFFNEAGEPYNPYSKSYWWEKYSAMVEAGVHILREKDIKEYLTYVKDTYGENYLKSFKIKRGS